MYAIGLVTLSKVSMPKQHSVISLEMPSDEEPHTMSKPIFKPNTFDTTSDDNSISDVASQVSENSHTSWQNQASHMTDDVTSVELKTKVSITWHLKLLLAIQMKTSSTTPIFNFKHE
jgi:hypothetical protein